MAGVHHHDAVGQARHHAQIVGDEDDGRVDLVLDLDQHLEHLSLHGHVEGSGRLVGDEQVWVAGDGHGDHGPLPHASRELVRVHLGSLAGLGDAHEVEQLDRPLEGLLLVGALVDSGHLADLPADRVHRVERREGVLEDHRDLLPPHGAALVLGEREQVTTLPEDLALGDVERRLQVQDRHGCHRLARTRLAHDGEHLAACHIERHAVDRLHAAVIGVEPGPHVPQRQQHLLTWRHRSPCDFVDHVGHGSTSAWGRGRRAGRRR